MYFLESVLWLTLNVYHEARSESDLGRQAVAHVTLNRAAQQDLSVPEVVLAPRQFSWTRKKKDNPLPEDPKAFLACLDSAMAALIQEDFTKGATYFHRADIEAPWTRQLTYLTQLGAHKFYQGGGPEEKGERATDR
ncbi:MAG: cell wall hydrolase [Desulfobulbaceae bacterium A2]|nr:MAG: cell wall hydrolase [Desulfobulbaceae bacterium A2]